MQISDRGFGFIGPVKGFVPKAYRWPAGVLTIGMGFTNCSPAVRASLGKIDPVCGSAVIRPTVCCAPPSSESSRP